VLLDKQALRSALQGSISSSTPTNVNRGNGHLTLRIKARLKRCGGEIRLVLPANSGGEIPANPLPSLIKAVARAHDWCERIVRDELTGGRSTAQATGLDERYVSRILQCAFLAPDIVASILDGRQPSSINLEDFRTRVPIKWAEQLQLFGLAVR
jgi:site-specific DNA recombinase